MGCIKSLNKTHHPKLKKWWEFMNEILDMHPNHSPKSFRCTKCFIYPDGRLLVTSNQGFSNWAIE
jgi:hypothetical protein